MVCSKQEAIIDEFNKNDEFNAIQIGDVMTFSPGTANSENVTITGIDTSNFSFEGNSQLLIVFEPPLGNVHSTGAVVVVRGIPFVPTLTTSSSTSTSTSTSTTSTTTTTTTDAPQGPVYSLVGAGGCRVEGVNVDSLKAGMAVPAADLNECLKRCDDTPKCVGAVEWFSKGPNEGRCQLQRAFPDGSSGNPGTSGVECHALETGTDG
jgi:hypothetical protein